MKVGYARVSTKHQSLEYQIANLEKAGCEKIFSDIISGYNKPKPQFDLMLTHLREGDILVATTLDRLGRNNTELNILLNEFHMNGINLYLISNPELDTRTSTGLLLFQLNAVFAENERMRTIERVNLSIEGRRARGREGGRPIKLDPKKLMRMKKLYEEKRLSINELCIMYDICKTSLYNYLKKYEEKEK